MLSNFWAVGIWKIEPRSERQEPRGLSLVSWFSHLASFFFLLAKAQRPACGRQAQRNLTAKGSISALASSFLSLASFFFLRAKTQRPVRCGRQAQRNLTVNSSISSRLLVLFNVEGWTPSKE
jgi:hypothetical protein